MLTSSLVLPVGLTVGSFSYTGSLTKAASANFCALASLQMQGFRVVRGGGRAYACSPWGCEEPGHLCIGISNADSEGA